MGPKLLFVALAVFAGGYLVADLRSSSDVYTLYFSHPALDNKRLHMATFDGDSEKANREDCKTTAQLWTDKPGDDETFWCEKGRFRP